APPRSGRLSGVGMGIRDGLAGGAGLGAAGVGWKPSRPIPAGAISGKSSGGVIGTRAPGLIGDWNWSRESALAGTGSPWGSTASAARAILPIFPGIIFRGPGIAPGVVNFAGPTVTGDWRPFGATRPATSEA